MTDLKNDIDRLYSIAKNNNFKLDLFLSGLSEIIKTGLFIFDNNGLRIAGALPSEIESPIAKALFYKNSLAESTLKMLQSGAADISNNCHHKMYYRELEKNIAVNILLVCAPGISSSISPEVVLDTVCEYVLFCCTGPDSSSLAFLDHTLADMLSGKSVSMEDFRTALGDTREKPYNCMIAIEFSDHPATIEDWVGTSEKFKEILNNPVVTILNGRIIMIVQAVLDQKAIDTMRRSKWESSIFRSGYSHSHLNDLLVDINARACISPATHELGVYSEQYALICDTLVISRDVYVDNTFSNICLYEDYQLLIVYKRYFTRHLRTHSKRTLKLYIYPEILKLLLFDYKNNQNLTEILYRYFVNQYDSARTANDLYIHRNTLYNKIKQIQSILEIDFSGKTDPSPIMDSLKLYYLIKLHFKIDIENILFGKPEE